MNRVTITLDRNGDIARICADEPIEIYTVSPHTPGDRVYRFGRADFGIEHVQEEISGFPIGHEDDGTFQSGDGVSFPKLPPA